MKYILQYRYKGGKLGKPIQIGARSRFSLDEAKLIRASLRNAKAIQISDEQSLDVPCISQAVR